MKTLPNKLNEIAFWSKSTQKSIHFTKNDAGLWTNKNGQSFSLEELYSSYNNSDYYLQLNPIVNNKTHFIVLDLDTKKIESEATREAINRGVGAILRENRISFLNCYSRSGKGFHYWIPFSNPLDIDITTRLFQGIADYVNSKFDTSNLIEVFPKGVNSKIVAPVYDGVKIIAGEFELEYGGKDNYNRISSLIEFIQTNNIPTSIIGYFLLYKTPVSNGFRNALINGLVGTIKNSSSLPDKDIERTCINLWNIIKPDSDEDRVAQIKNTVRNKKPAGAKIFTEGVLGFDLDKDLKSVFKKDAIETLSVEESILGITKDIYRNNTFYYFEEDKKIFIKEDNNVREFSKEEFFTLLELPLLEKDIAISVTKKNNMFSSFLTLVISGQKKSGLILDSVENYIYNRLIDEKYIYLENGVLSLIDNKLYDYTELNIIPLPELKLNRKIVDNKEDMMKIENYLKSLVDPADFNTFVRILASTLYRDNEKTEFASIFTGKGANGKSGLLNVLKDMLGFKFCSNIPLKRLVAGGFIYSELYNKMLNVGEEIGASNQLSSNDLSVLKTLSSGNPLLADKKFSKGVAFSPFSKLIFTTNNLPRIDIDDYGFYRRVILINFPYNVDCLPKESKQTFRLLKDKTTKEYWLDCLFSYLIKHLSKMLKELKDTDSIHFDYCYEVEENEKRYKELSIPALIYLKNPKAKLEITGDPKDTLTTREVRDIIVTGLNEMKVNHNYDSLNDGGLLTKDLQKCGDVHSSRKTIEGEVRTIYTGIRIKTNNGPDNKEPVPEIKEETTKEVNEIIDVLNEKEISNKEDTEIECLDCIERTADGDYIINGCVFSKKEIEEYKIVFVKEGNRNFAEPDCTYVLEVTNPLTNKKDYIVRPTEKFLLDYMNNKFRSVDN